MMMRLSTHKSIHSLALSACALVACTRSQPDRGALATASAPAASTVPAKQLKRAPPPGGPAPCADPPQCDAACSRGDAEACIVLARDLEEGVRVPRDERRSAEAARRACDAGLAIGCQQFAWHLQDGAGVEKDEGTARLLGSRACEAGASVACNNVGVLLLKGRGGGKDLEGAVTHFQRACRAGRDATMHGCSNLAGMYEHGIAVPRDLGRAVALYGRACVDLSAPACNRLGQILTSKVEVVGDEYFRKACTLGHRGACEHLSAAGKALPSAPAGTRLCHQPWPDDCARQCSLGHAASCLALGLMYKRGANVPEDPLRAAESFDKACALGDAGGCGWLGSLLLSSRDASFDAAKGFALLSRACEHGSVLGCSALGFLLVVAGDSARGAPLLRVACEGGDAPGCAELARLTAEGIAVPKDAKRAQELFQLACSGGWSVPECDSLNP